LACAVSVLAALWRLTPLGDAIDPEAIRDRLMALRDRPWAIPVVWTAFVVGGFLVAPINALFLAVGLTFDVLPAIGLNVSGGVLSALSLHEVGRRFDVDALLERSPRLKRLKQRHLENAGVLELTLLRFLPLGPFTTMCLLWAAAGVRRREMLVATALGLLPGAVAASLIGRSVALRTDPHGLALAIAGCAVFVALMWLGHRLLARQTD
jgi:uncharacterized membrane protein YdjX (TVP38/TMEM64 family)